MGFIPLRLELTFCRPKENSRGRYLIAFHRIPLCSRCLFLPKICSREWYSTVLGAFFYRRNDNLLVCTAAKGPTKQKRNLDALVTSPTETHLRVAVGNGRALEPRAAASGTVVVITAALPNDKKITSSRQREGGSEYFRNHAISPLFLGDGIVLVTCGHSALFRIIGNPKKTLNPGLTEALMGLGARFYTRRSHSSSRPWLGGGRYRTMPTQGAMPGIMRTCHEGTPTVVR